MGRINGEALEGMRPENIYQSFLILLGIVTAVLFGTFLYREVFPEYKIYQDRYIALEKLRSQITGNSVPLFKKGVKQIVIPSKDNGPETIDRCISCHVALQLEHFSPTKIAKDINGNVVYDLEGKPVQEPNESYIWGFVDSENQDLKTVYVGEHKYDVTKVLAMHPLIGRETRPFEFHPLEEYGCTSCHSGNGRGLVTDRAHGPVFDGQYETTPIASKPQFLEVDEKNDPSFSKVFNDKPGHRLLFQTTPIYVGSLIQAKCVQCHQPTSGQVDQALNSLGAITVTKDKEHQALKNALLDEQAALISLITTKQGLSAGLKEMIEQLEKKKDDYSLSEKKRKQAQGQYAYILKYQDRDLGKQIDFDLVRMLGSKKAVRDLEENIKSNGDVNAFLKNHKEGSLYEKTKRFKEEHESVLRLQNLESPLNRVRGISSVQSGVDQLTQNYQSGESLYISQACYACHRIAGVARGGVGPELTNAGHLYPWYIKESIVWPQADLRTSVMPNMHLDHEELEDLTTYLLAQRYDRQLVSDVKRKSGIRAWDEGKKTPIEEPLKPSEVRNLDVSMTIFATDGCAACHRLKGYESTVGFVNNTMQERVWFRNLFPRDVLGSKIISTLDEKGKEIDKRIVDGGGENALLEKIEKEYPGLLESFYSNFKFASRAKNSEEWKERVRRVLMVFIQEYGLGRLIGPPVSYSGVYRSDQWLMQHFWNPSSHSAKSIMPTFPFDNTKFLALTYMLNELGKKNRDALREVWDQDGFNPVIAYQNLCSNCHGPYLQGNGPVAQWIYPVPKSLRNALFLRNQTKEMVQRSIVHGIKGGPMAPWGEVAEGKEGSPVLTEEEIAKIVDWIFSDLPGEHIINEEEIFKWRYMPEDVLEELQKEGDTKKLEKEDAFSFLPKGEGCYAAVDPWVPVEKKEGELDPWKPKEGYPKALKVGQVFNVVEENSPDGKRPAYYIKEKYYTDKNIMQGEHYFMLHCSICHGREGDGAGLRAGTMQEAKPRMLTNLDWIETRDDLRLLQSIKYGVAGTSMTPWGDVTSSLQRMQLVMFIRNLSHQQRELERLNSAVYNAFDTSKWAIEKARSFASTQIAELEKSYNDLQFQREEALINETSSRAAMSYGEELRTKKELEKEKKKDQKLEKIITLEGSLREIFFRTGNSILSLKGEGSRTLFNDWLKMVNLNGKGFSSDNGKLEINAPDQNAIGSLRNQMQEGIIQKLQVLEKEVERLKGKLSSSERNEDLEIAQELINSYKRLQNQLIASLSEAERIRKQEKGLYEQYHNIR